MVRGLQVFFLVLFLIGTAVLGFGAPVNRVTILALLAGGAPADEVTRLIQQRGLSFQPTLAFLNLVEQAESPHDPDGNSLLRAISAGRLVIPLSPAPPKESETLEHLARGAQLDRNVFPPNPEKYAAAESEIRQALQIDSENPLIHFALGKVLADEGKFGLAIAEFRQTVITMPTLSVAHVSLGNALAREGDLNQAIAELRKAVQLAPDSTTARSVLAAVLFRNHDPAPGTRSTSCVRAVAQK
ncbi:MAG: tetratricopeptide repeat protein, partial [Terriglobia bacterium]